MLRASEWFWAVQTNLHFSIWKESATIAHVLLSTKGAPSSKCYRRLSPSIVNDKSPNWYRPVLLDIRNRNLPPIAISCTVRAAIFACTEYSYRGLKKINKQPVGCSHGVVGKGKAVSGFRRQLVNNAWFRSWGGGFLGRDLSMQPTNPAIVHSNWHPVFIANANDSHYPLLTSFWALNPTIPVSSGDFRAMLR